MKRCSTSLIIIIVMSIISIVIVPLYSLEHQILFSPPDTSTTGCHFCFGPAFSFFLELFLCSSQVVYWISTNLGTHLPVSYLFAFSYCSWVLEARILRCFAIPFSLNSLAHSFIEIHKVMLKILQARLQQYMNQELPNVQIGFRKGRGTNDQIANIHWIIEKARKFQKNIYFCFTDKAKAFVWITIN